MNIGDLVTLDEIEREHVAQVLQKSTHLKQEEVARMLGIDTCTLYRKRKRWGLTRGGLTEQGELL